MTDRLRWKLIAWLTRPLPPMVLVGFALARAGYMDYPEITDEGFTIHAPRGEDP